MNFLPVRTLPGQMYMHFYSTLHLIVPKKLLWNHFKFCQHNARALSIFSSHHGHGAWLQRAVLFIYFIPPYKASVTKESSGNSGDLSQIIHLKTNTIAGKASSSSLNKETNYY